MGRKKKKLNKPSKEEVERFLKEHPGLVASFAAVILKLLTEPVEHPAWLKDAVPVNQTLAGPWRGKGSFGKGFGPNKIRRK